MKEIIIKGFIETSLLDWDGMIVSTLYLPHCNFRCPYCQNAGLLIDPEQYLTVPFEDIKEYLISHKDWIDGVCLTGGEPCMNENIISFIQKIKELDIKLKLDTNGTFPDVLKTLLDMKLIDYIAMDIKAPLEEQFYTNCIGLKSEALLENIKRSIDLIMNSNIGYEFRTTVVPCLHKKEDIEKIAKYIKGTKKYVLQNFVAQNTLDPSFMNVKSYNKEEMDEICQGVVPHVKECVVRGV